MSFILYTIENLILLTVGNIYVLDLQKVEEHVYGLDIYFAVFKKQHITKLLLIKA